MLLDIRFCILPLFYFARKENISCVFLPQSWGKNHLQTHKVLQCSNHLQVILLCHGRGMHRSGDELGQPWPTKPQVSGALPTWTGSCLQTEAYFTISGGDMLRPWISHPTGTAGAAGAEPQGRFQLWVYFWVPLLVLTVLTFLTVSFSSVWCKFRFSCNT